MKYFGTDGIRNKANFFTTEFLTKIVAGLIDYAGDNIKIMLGGDTRESTEWILHDLSNICNAFGIEYINVGVLPTPAINYCFYQMGYDFAIDVTASHNPYTDNGIKIFMRGETSGAKLASEGCQAIEAVLDSDRTYPLTAPVLEDDISTDVADLYKSHLLDYLGDNTDFTGLNIAVDCANGATSVIGDAIFKELGGNTTLIHADTNYNTKINQDCGSTHLESLQKLVKEKQFDFGVAFDGDGDRCLLVDHQGAVVDGDEIIAIIANFLQLDKIAITVMANQGLLNWAEANHIKTEITAVGDSNVAEAMRVNYIKLGGEQSGHIILPGESTGDGMLTALMITKIVSETNKSLYDLAHIMRKSPQVIVNLPANDQQKESFKTAENVKKLLLEYSQKLKSENGRLLVRPSGTESLIRITMWGDNEDIINELAINLKNDLGAIL